MPDRVQEIRCVHCGKQPPSYCVNCFACMAGQVVASEKAMTASEQDLRGFFAGMVGEANIVEWVLGWHQRHVAWATGQPKKPFWCSHMVYRRREDGWDGTGWVLEAGAGFEVKENWAVCPVCTKPKPKEA